MKKLVLLLTCIAALFVGAATAHADPWNGIDWQSALGVQLPPPPAGVSLCEGHGGGDGVDSYTEIIYTRGGTAIIEHGVVCPDGTKVPTSIDMAPAVDPGLNLQPGIIDDQVPVDGSSDNSYATPAGDDYCQNVWDSGGWDENC